MKSLNQHAEAASIGNVIASKLDFITGFKEGYFRAIKLFAPIVLILCFMCMAFGYLVNKLIEINQSSSIIYDNGPENCNCYKLPYQAQDTCYLRHTGATFKKVNDSLYYSFDKKNWVKYNPNASQIDSDTLEVVYKGEEGHLYFKHSNK